MISASRIFSPILLLLLATAVQAQTLQLTCKVQWEKDCLTAVLRRQECPKVFGPETATGTITIEGNKARTKDLGVVTEYSVNKPKANEFALEGEWTNSGYYMRGHGVFDSSTWQLRLFMTLGKNRSDENILQRGLVADCR
jgi:hypothetical protein